MLAAMLLPMHSARDECSEAYATRKHLTAMLDDITWWKMTIGDLWYLSRAKKIVARCEQ